MKKVFGALLMAAVLALPTLAAAEPWAVVASEFSLPSGSSLDDREGLFTVDLGAVPPRVYGPFLQGVLTQKAGPGVFDVAMLPNGREALVSNFGDMKVYRIDLADPTNPRLTGALRTQWDTGLTDPDTGEPIIYSFFAEDIAVSRDGSFAIVTDGGFSPYLAFIDLATFKVKKIQKTVVPNPRFPDDPSKDRTYNAQSVAITPDGRTVLFVDYFSGKVNWGLVNATKDGLTSFHSIFLCSKGDATDPMQCDGIFARPVNVTIAPDGETALVANASADRKDAHGNWDPVDGVVAVLKIDRATGAVSKGMPFFLSGLPARDALTPEPTYSIGGNQSIAIARNGQAFVITQPLGVVDDPASDDPADKIGRRNILAQLKITGPGAATVHEEKCKTLASRGTSQLFGVDNLAFDGGGRWVLASNPTLSGGTSILTALDVLTWKASYIKLPNGAIPVGVAFTR
jgi:autotransporter-associated beta strand protein